MKKRVFLLFLLLLIPTIVLAKDTCNDNDIKIKSITLKEVNGFSEEVQESTINNNTINLNLKMYDVGDSSTYNISIENTSGEEYYFTKDSMKIENDYLEYSLKNDSEIIPAKATKTIELRVTYKNKIPNDNYSDTSKLIISLSDKPLENPKTNTNYYLLVILLVILIPISIKYHKKGLLVLSAFGIISNVYALCTVSLNIEAKIEIVNKEAIFLPGREVNAKMKQLAGDDTSTVTNGYSFQDQLITSIKYSSIEPIESEKQEKNIVSTSESPYPIYMWYDNGTIYWWSEDIHPNLNEKTISMFHNLTYLNDISGLINFDSSSVKNMDTMFYNTSLSSLSSLEKWNTYQVETLSYAFSEISHLTSLEGLENWDVSNVENLRGIFRNNSLLSDITAIKNWNVKKVKDIGYMFRSCISLEIVDFSNWNTLSLENMCNIFGMWDSNSYPRYDSKLHTIILSEKFDTSKVTDMYAMFANNTHIEDYNFLKYFDTSNVVRTAQMFQNNDGMRNLDPLKDWDVSKVTDMKGMFIRLFYLEDASGINDWNISPTADFSYIFNQTNLHPEFSKVSGTWNSQGTFIPSI